MYLKIKIGDKIEAFDCYFIVKSIVEDIAICQLLPARDFDDLHLYIEDITRIIVKPNYL